jgi:microcompartment protein CcmL/EutN
MLLDSGYALLERGKPLRALRVLARSLGNVACDVAGDVPAFVRASLDSGCALLERGKSLRAVQVLARRLGYVASDINVCTAAMSLCLSSKSSTNSSSSP